MAQRVDFALSDAVCRCNAGGQASFFSDWRTRYLALEGGWASGKTWVGARKLLTLHLWNAFDAAGRPTFVPSACIAPTYRNAKDYDLPAILSAAAEFNLRAWWRSSDMEIALRAPNGAACFAPIMIRTADAPERITGWEVGAFWGDEAARWKSDEGNPLFDPLTQIKGRLRHPSARVLQGFFTFTNEGDHTAIYREFRRGDSDHALFRASTRDNQLMAEFCATMERQLTPELARQYIDGGAIALSGAKVYPQFDPALHVSDQVALVPGLPLHLALDFNINPGMHAELGQYHQDRDLFQVAHEITGPRMDVRGVCAALGQLIGRLGGWKWPELLVYGDATGRSEWAGTSQSCYVILFQGLDQLGIPYRVRVPASNPPVNDRINAFNCALLDMQGKVHWQCHPRCLKLIDDLRTLHRDDAGEIDESNHNLKHASDAEGYRVHFVRPLRIGGSNLRKSDVRFGV
jgi:hypothetical protein